MSISSTNNRRIKFHQHWSDETALDLIMSGSTPLPATTAKISNIDIAGLDGTIDTSKASGSLKFNPITISYVFTHEISRYGTNGTRLTVPEMNRVCNDHVSEVRNWIYAKGSYEQASGVFIPDEVLQQRFYDTGLCDPDNRTGYWLMNSRCTNFTFNKAISSEKWVIQYQIEITADPYMYEYTANPRTYAMFSGPTDDGYGMDHVSARIFTLSGSTDTRTKYLWTNDNRTWIQSTSGIIQSFPVTEDGVTKTAYLFEFSFNPSIISVYSGHVGFYINSYVDYTYDGTSYQYHLFGNKSTTSGDATYILSSKLATAYEMGYTDQNGFTFRQLVINDGSSSIEDLVEATNGHIPVSIIWGGIKSFSASDTTDFVVTAHTKGINTFQQVTGASGSTIYYTTHTFGDTFNIDNDPYNELVMSRDNYGFYSLESPDNTRRTI